MVEWVVVRKKSRVKSRWHLVEGRVVSVRFSEINYKILERRAEGRGMSVGAYLRLLFMATKEGEESLEVVDDADAPPPAEF